MSLLVTGSIGIDTVEAPAGTAECVLGGSVVYFAYAASFFGPVRVVGVVGEDLPQGFLAPLEQNSNIDTTGIEVRKGSRTFRWHGRYHQDVNVRDTVEVDLNVLEEVGPQIPQQFRDSDFVFLANTHPGLQMELLGQLEEPRMVVADTMDLWITTEREKLVELMNQLDGLVLNDAEARLLTEEHNVVVAGSRIADMVRGFVVVKKGEHGSLVFTEGKVYPVPACPSVDVVDPTGAGDSFAGAMMGYLASCESPDTAALRRAIAYGTVTATITLKDFSLNGLKSVSRDDIHRGLDDFRTSTQF